MKIKTVIIGLVLFVCSAVAQLSGSGYRTVKLTFDYPTNAPVDQFVLRYLAATQVNGVPAPATNWVGLATIPGTSRIFTVSLPVGIPFFLFATAENTNGGWVVSDPSNVVTLLGSPQLLRLQ